MRSPIDEIKALPRQHEFFIGIDSDGCVFDTMELKHKECFCPPFIRHFHLQAASKYGREVWDYVNLYSKMRGCNRYFAILHALDLLAQRPEVAARGIRLPKMERLRRWVQEETKLGNPALKRLLEKEPDPELQMAYDWSEEVNATVARTVHDVPPFPSFLPAVRRAHERADIIVVSQTPLEALVREWKEHGIDRYVNFIAGQEHGTKKEHIEYAAGGKYPPDRILMVGDAPGDYKAAQANGCLFFPIVPGREEDSWRELAAEGLDRFFRQEFAGPYQERLLRAFDQALPDQPPWK